MNIRNKFAAITGILIVSFIFTTNGLGDKQGKRELKKAITFLKNIDPERLSSKQKKQVGEKIQAAWETVKAHKDKGVSELKKEMNSAGNNDYFKLNACALIWNMKGMKEAPFIGKTWGDTDLSVNYNYVFFPAFEAAMKQDLKALPMLKAILKDKDGRVYITPHSMWLNWPMTHEFIWGQVGYKAVSILNKILDTSKDENTIESAILILTKHQSIEALDEIRKHAKSKKKAVRNTAIRALGMFGHPDDFTLITNRLNSRDEESVWYAMYALYEYEDLRAVPLITKHLNAKAPPLIQETIATLHHLLTPGAMAALEDCLNSGKLHENAKSMCSETIESIFKNQNISFNDYKKLNKKGKIEFCEKYRKKSEEKYRLKRSDKRIDRAMFSRMVKEMMAANRITVPKYEWVEDRHVLSIATHKDLEMLCDLRASLYARLSDECLYETRKLDNIIKRLGRSRYRKEVGVSARVQGIKK